MTVTAKSRALQSAFMRLMKLSGTTPAEDASALALMLFRCAETMVKNGTYGSRGEALAHIGNSTAMIWASEEMRSQQDEDPAKEIADTVAECLIHRYSNGVE